MLSHIEFVHQALKKHVKRGDHVVDATCGNGHDAALLAELALGTHCGHLTCIDIQKDAIDATEARLGRRDRIAYLLGSHEELPKDVSTIVYNLGYLPTGDKTITTQVVSTINSLSNAVQVLLPGGLIALTIYPGHPEGKEESVAIEQWVKDLPFNELNLFLYKDVHSSTKPYVYLIKKKRITAS